MEPYPLGFAFSCFTWCSRTTRFFDDIRCQRSTPTHTAGWLYLSDANVGCEHCRRRILCTPAQDEKTHFCGMPVQTYPHAPEPGVCCCLISALSIRSTWSEANRGYCMQLAE